MAINVAGVSTLSVRRTCVAFYYLIIFSYFFIINYQHLIFSRDDCKLYKAQFYPVSLLILNAVCVCVCEWGGRGNIMSNYLHTSLKYQALINITMLSSTLQNIIIFIYFY